MQNNILITGIAGQTGSYLAEYLLKQNKFNINGTIRYRSDLTNIKDIKHQIKLHDCDLKDAHNVDKLIKEIKPIYIFHLAATSFVKSSFNQPAEVMYNNTISQVNLLEAIIKHCPKSKVQIAGSSEQYGLVLKEETPITENNPLKPLSPYGVSKCAQEALAQQYYYSYKLETIITRTFNHTSSRRGEAFVESTFCEQIAAIEAGLKEPIIYHGNLDSIRDYTDARDIAKAYWLAINYCEPATPYNICSGNKITIGELLNLLIELSTNKKIKTIEDKNRLRPSDVTLLHGDSTKFRNKTKWEPKYSLECTMKDLLNTWRHKYNLIK